LTELVGEARLVTVTGPGGVGKTRLVTEAHDRLEAVAGAAPTLVALADVASGADAEAIAAELGMGSPEAVALSHDEGPGPVLVLDNGEHVLDGAADFVSRLLAASEKVTVVVTSRAPLDLAEERVLVLDPLAPPSLGDPDPRSSPAVELFLERAEAGGGRWERSDDAVGVVAELCRVVDGLPLAIELAATRARALGPAELLALVSERLDVLRTTERDRPERHRSVRAAFEVSVELLDEESRLLLWRLGIFEGPFDLDLVHAVAGPDPDDRIRTVDLLGGLVDRSLVVAEPSATSTRYRLLALVHELTADGLRTAGRWDETVERYVAAMTDEAGELIIGGATRWTAELMARAVARVSHLIAAIDFAVERDDGPARAFQMFVPLLAAAHQSRSPEVRAVGRRLVERWPDAPAPWRAEALAVFATSLAIGHVMTEAEEIARRSLDETDATPLGRALAERALTLAAIGREDHRGALEHARAGRAHAAEGAAPSERELRGFEASLLDRLGEVEEAKRLAAEAAEVSVEQDDPITEIWCRLVSATIAIREEDWPAARVEVTRARELGEQIDDGWWGGSIFRSWAMLTAYEAAAGTERDGWSASRPLWLQAVERAAQRGDLSELAFTLRAAAVVASRSDQESLALELLAAAPPIRELTVLPELYPDVRRHLEQQVQLDPDEGDRPSIVVAYRAALAALGADAPSAPSRSAPSPDHDAVARKEGTGWALTYRDTTVRLPDLKGLGDLAVLLARPDHEVHCLDLMGGVDVGGGTGPEVDEQARRKYQARILDLQGEIDEAKEANDLGRAEKAEVELDALVAQLSEAFGLGGRARGKGSAAERARTAVTYRIRAAIRKVAEQHEGLGRHLASSVQTGTWCAYRPEQPVRWQIEGV